MNSINKSMNKGPKTKESNKHQTVVNKNTMVDDDDYDYDYDYDYEDAPIDSTSIKRITKDEIDTCKLMKSMQDKSGKSGATLIYVGSVRNYGKNGLIKEMFYESYVKMAEKRIKNIEKIAIKRWDIKKIRIIHRIGSMKLGNSSVVIAVSTPHSKDAFEACEFILAAIKKEVPIWKKEILSNSEEKWVGGNLITIGE